MAVLLEKMSLPGCKCHSGMQCTLLIGPGTRIAPAPRNPLKETFMTMKMLRAVAISLVAAGALLQAGCASSPDSRATGQVVDDAALTARVKSALAVDAGVETAANVDVTSYRGVVQLSGFVESQDAARRAVAVAKQVDGVRSVRNDLRVNPSRR
jgi:hypothetical protein